MKPHASVISDKTRPKGLGTSQVNIGGKFQIRKKSYQKAPLSAILCLYLCKSIFSCTVVSISCIVRLLPAFIPRYRRIIHSSSSIKWYYPISCLDGRFVRLPVFIHRRIIRRTSDPSMLKFVPDGWSICRRNSANDNNSLSRSFDWAWVTGEIAMCICGSRAYSTHDFQYISQYRWSVKYIIVLSSLVLYSVAHLSLAFSKPSSTEYHLMFLPHPVKRQFFAIIKDTNSQ